MNLEKILSEIKQNLKLAVKNRKDNFHLGYFSTIFEDFPFSRTVVLRRFDEDTFVLYFHTDIRTEKIKHLNKNSNSTWMFYDFVRKVQLRLYGKSIINYKNSLSRDHWEKSQEMSRKCYLQLKESGKTRDNHEPLFPPEFVERTPTFEESEIGYNNFCVISTEVYKIDWLYLDSNGHIRAIFNKIDGEFSGTWIIP